MNKVFSQISDYGTNFELLQFHYDLWHDISDRQYA